MEIKDYLKYYIGCEAVFDNRKWLIDFYDVRQNIVRLRRTDDGYPKYNEVWPNEMKLVLRRLSSMTEQEGIPLFGTDKYWDVVCGEGDCKSFTPASFHYLLSRGFWLFGEEAFEKGLIINQSSLNTSK